MVFDTVCVRFFPALIFNIINCPSMVGERGVQIHVCLWVQCLCCDEHKKCLIKSISSSHSQIHLLRKHCAWSLFLLLIFASWNNDSYSLSCSFRGSNSAQNFSLYGSSVSINVVITIVSSSHCHHHHHHHHHHYPHHHQVHGNSALTHFLLLVRTNTRRSRRS